MSYDIYIGNLEMVECDEETEFAREINGETVYFEKRVPEIKLPEAPTFPNDEMTGNSNNRHPSYHGWSEFCQVAGIYSLFFHEREGLMRNHPGVQMLTKEHATAIKQALEAWKSSHPNAVPGFDPFSWSEVSHTGNDPILARLIWLDFWVTWAVTHCEHSAIENY